MKATKKIVGAACALVAAVALSAGSTFAWFSSNTKVNVKGMKVQAVVPDNIYIKKNVERDITKITDVEVDFGETDSSGSHLLSPAIVELGVDSGAKSTDADKTANLGNALISEATEYTAEPNATSSGTASKWTIRGVVDRITHATSNSGEATATNFAAVYNFSINRAKEVNTTAVNSALECVATIKIKAADLSATDQTWKFIRTAFFVDSASTEHALAANIVSMENNITTLDDETIESVAYKQLQFEYTGDDAVVASGSFFSNTAYVISFIVYFDGDDSDCFVNNAITTDIFDVTLEFTAKDTNKT